MTHHNRATFSLYLLSTYAHEHDLVDPYRLILNNAFITTGKPVRGLAQLLNYLYTYYTYSTPRALSNATLHAASELKVNIFEFKEGGVPVV